MARLLAEAEAADGAEDSAHGPGRAGGGLPEELARRQGRLAKIAQAKAMLEGRARKAAAEEAARREAEGKAPPETAPADAAPGPKDRINFTDPESRIMPVSNKGWDRCGKARAVADEARIILAAGVTDRANDKRQAVPMIDRARANLGAAGVSRAIGAGLMGAGYCSEEDTAGSQARGIDPYVATGRLKHDEEIPPAPRGRIPAGLAPKPRMARELRTKAGRETYARREAIIEPIFGQPKRVPGSRRSSMRGLAAMRSEWRLTCAVHNLLKLRRHAQAAMAV